ncbi:hypothetical protein, partial [Methanocalculus sp. MSAO_Arc2]|uniref:hypothetical protein n=1 Tax=Methanocalculus sp. MSAO_Arc2 TaxID=2293855 RepID=UPI0032168774
MLIRSHIHALILEIVTLKIPQKIDGNLDFDRDTLPLFQEFSVDDVETITRNRLADLIEELMQDLEQEL